MRGEECEGLDCCLEGLASPQTVFRRAGAPEKEGEAELVGRRSVLRHQQKGAFTRAGRPGPESVGPGWPVAHPEISCRYHLATDRKGKGMPCPHCTHAHARARTNTQHGAANRPPSPPGVVGRVGRRHQHPHVFEVALLPGRVVDKVGVLPGGVEDGGGDD